MATIRHARWFEEHATHSSVKVLIRIIKDVKKRFDGFKALNTWSIELLVIFKLKNSLILFTLFLNFSVIIV